MKFPINWSYLLGAVALVVGLGWIGWSSLFSPSQINNIPEKYKDFYNIFQNDLEEVEVCSNKHYQTNLINTSGIFTNPFFSKLAIFDVEEMALLGSTQYTQLDQESYKQFGKALAWQVCNGNRFFTDAALKKESESNLILNVNHPLCDIWPNDGFGGTFDYNLPYRPLYMDP